MTTSIKPPTSVPLSGTCTPCRAVTYRVGKPRPGTLRLWSLQPLPVWEQLCRSKTLNVDLSRINVGGFFEDMLWQYNWMREQMARRLSHYQGHYPWWAYFRPKPDLRIKAWEIEPFGAPYVRLELAVDANRVLLSNLEAWWAGMGNHSYVGVDVAEEEAWSAEIEQHGLGELDWPMPEPWHSRKAASWEHIFDVEALAAEDLWPDVVQATFETLVLADVIGVTEFTARRPHPLARRHRPAAARRGESNQPEAAALVGKGNRNKG